MDGAPLLPVVEDWWDVREVAEGVVRLTEPRTHELVRANAWWVRGRDRDLVVDAGLGVASLRAGVPELFEHDPAVVVTHAHLDHQGGAHEFGECWAHPLDPVATPVLQPLDLAGVARALGIPLEDGTPDALLIDAVPGPGYDPAAYRLRPVTPTRALEDGTRIDLGDRRLQVLHLPGHTHGSIALLDLDTGALFSGDVIYDDGGVDGLIDQLGTGDVAAYRRTMRRLLSLPVATVYGGHGDPFGQERLSAIAEGYLASRPGDAKI